jgi:hypothetical protein
VYISQFQWCAPVGLPTEETETGELLEREFKNSLGNINKKQKQNAYIFL